MRPVFSRERAGAASLLIALVAMLAALPASASTNARRTLTTQFPTATKHHWRLHQTGSPGAIEGYVDATSVLPGQQVQLFVSTTADAFIAHAYRIGWDQGNTGTLVWSSPKTAGEVQPAAVIESRGMVETRWPPSLTFSTAGWPPGDYLIRLDSSTGDQRYVPLTVRATSAAGRLVLISPVTTWQAYNLWGCCDLYEGADGAFASRSRAVSFDRPYQQNDGSGEFLTRERPVLTEAERLNLPLDYITDVDLRDPHILDGAAGVVSMGHDEYWSPAMRNVLTAARDHGTNLAFFGANAIFRRIRYAASHLGDSRVEINYKIATEDPLYGKHNRRVTSDWPSPPYPDPESSLIGAQYGCFPGQTRVPGYVSSPQSWVFNGTGVVLGTALPGLVGPEIDAVQPSYPTPAGIQVLLHSPVSCPGGDPAYQDTSYYVAPSGAGVFDAGTIDWACDVGGNCYADDTTTRVIRQVTDNVLTRFAEGPMVSPTH
jgi:hypothetical protein